MQLIATADLMRGFDRAAITRLRIPGLVLMENAGRAFVGELERACGPFAGKQTVVVCGKGNNGGDGFVIARHIANRGGEVLVLLLASKRSVAGDAKTNLEAVIRMSRMRGAGIRFAVHTGGGGKPPLPGTPDIVVDAIFGTGFSGDMGSRERGIVAWINGSGAFVASVDIPSGVDATSGTAGNAAVKADLTVAMGLAKIGHYIGRGCDASGTVRIADIGVPPALYRAGRTPVFRILREDVAAILPARARNAHKYSAGKVLVIAGSRAFTGAPILTSEAALRSGAGAVVLAFPASIHQVLARRLTEVLLAPVPDTPEGTFGPGSLAAIRSRCAWADAVALGPGLGRNEETMAFVRELLAAVDKPFVVDADALFALKGYSSLLRKRKSPAVLTPHTGEFAALTGRDAVDAETFRVDAAREAARRFGCVMVLKGAPTVCAAPGGAVTINSTGNPGMATIGSGDVLTGVIAGFIAQGMPAERAACAGVFVHGLAGDIAAARFGVPGMLATDIGSSVAGAIAAAAGGSPLNPPR
jgi:hydroxyethylthiazole kinase-like uncharacterized protein yjeF